MERANMAVDIIKGRLEVCFYLTLKIYHSTTGKHVDSQVSMTFDSWTSIAGDPFLSITAHYVDVPKDNPQKWELRTEQLAFTPIRGNHSGANLAKILIETIDKFGLREKACGFYFCPTWSNSIFRLDGSRPTMLQIMTRRSKLWVR